MLIVRITHYKPFPKTCVIPTADRNIYNFMIYVLECSAWQNVDINLMHVCFHSKLMQW